MRVSAVDDLKMFMLNGDANVNKVIYKTLINSPDDKWPEVSKNALTILQTTFSPDDKVFEQEIIEQLADRIQKMTDADLNYEVRRNAELCLLAIRGRHLAKLRTLVATKKDMSLRR